MLYNLLTEKVILPATDKILKITFWKTYRDWQELEKKTKNELENIQLEKLKNILLFTTKNVPYYRNQDIKYDENPKKYLSRFEILTKQTLKEENLLVEGLEKSSLSKRTSSGSSGVQSTVYMSFDEVSMLPSIQALWWSWAGFRFGDKVLQMGNNPKRGIVKKFKDILLRFKYEDGFSLKEEDILKMLKEIQKHPRKFFLGYASVLYTIAKIADKHQINDIKFDAVFSLGDKMFSHYKRTIEKQFNTRIFDSYGCSEGLMMAAECEYGNYHIMSPHVYIEILDDNNQEVSIGEVGHVVVTRLDGFHMPLVRYKLGDMATKEDPNKKCKCGREFPLLAKIIGRETDILKFPSGQSATVHSFTGIFEYYTDIKQFQIVELKKGILVRYVKEKHFDINSLEKIKEELFKLIDQDLIVSFKEEEYIEPTSSGKPCLVMSYSQAKKLKVI